MLSDREFAKASNKPPVSPIFIKKGCDWKGIRWNIIVVGTRKTNKSKGPIIESCINITDTDPITNMQIAEISKRFA